VVDDSKIGLPVCLRMAETLPRFAMAKIRSIHEAMLTAEGEFDAAKFELKAALTRAEQLGARIDEQLGVNDEAAFNRCAEILRDLARVNGEYFNAITRPSQPSSRRGRRPGSVKRDWCHVVVPLLVAVVEEAGGRITFNKDYPDDNRLRRTLRLLTPFLPPMIDPETWPPGRIREAYDRARRGIKIRLSPPETHNFPARDQTGKFGSCRQ